jgi:hypothetical protein
MERGAKEIFLRLPSAGRPAVLFFLVALCLCGLIFYYSARIGYSVYSLPTPRVYLTKYLRSLASWHVLSFICYLLFIICYSAVYSITLTLCVNLAPNKFKTKKGRLHLQNNQWPWPDEMDALIAAPEHHKLLFENDSVRVLDTCIKAGEQTAVHTHRWPASLYILSWSDFIRYDAEGNVMVDSRTLGKVPSANSAIWTDALIPHSLKNIGDNDLHVISVELKRT